MLGEGGGGKAQGNTDILHPTAHSHSRLRGDEVLHLLCFPSGLSYKPSQNFRQRARTKAPEFSSQVSRRTTTRLFRLTIT